MTKTNAITETKTEVLFKTTRITKLISIIQTNVNEVSASVTISSKRNPIRLRCLSTCTIEVTTRSPIFTFILFILLTCIKPSHSTPISTNAPKCVKLLAAYEV
uniref:Uncharacterized protein n=1 Tax=Glossina pallidipes TaxID=7398 RepID=A0A1A9Z3R8_GLOPL